MELITTTITLTTTITTTTPTAVTTTAAAMTTTMWSFVESISAFAWEPVGHKFACIHGDSPRISVSFYNVRKGGMVELISE